MATKDWRQTDSTTWKNKKEHATLIMKSYGSATYVNISYFDNQNLWRDGTQKRFTDKSKAKTFAMNYMRTH